MATKQKILILDFGSQYSQLIARRIRECGVYCELLPYTISDEAIENFAPQGIILSGGPDSVTAECTPRAPERVFTLSCPVLGICYGMQTMAAQLGGQVETASHHEYGRADVRVTRENHLFADISDRVDSNGVALVDVWMSHGDRVITLPPGFVTIAQSDNTPIAAMADETRHFYGVQFHPEVTHTPQGMRLLQQFVSTLCGCKPQWTAPTISRDLIDEMRRTLGDDHVLLGLSGGVDSAVVAALLHQAIGEQLHCVFVDHGLLREGESEQVMTVFHDHFGMQVLRVDAAQEFFANLAGIQDPEEKRKQVGKTFIEVFARAAEGLTDIKWLAQGTIYPDVIESQAIKSHHNVGGLPEKLPFKLVEPLRQLFKDEVRALGLELGLPASWVQRHPFPGPGLALRVVGEVTESHVHCVRQADAIFLQELRAANLYHEVAQAFAVFLPCKTVGVTGDQRHYGHVISLRAVTTTDFMTAEAAPLPLDFLAQVATRIANEVKGVARVCYDITSKPPATIEWE